MRNSMVALYRRQPARRLSLEEVRQTIEGYDPGALRR